MIVQPLKNYNTVIGSDFTAHFYRGVTEHNCQVRTIDAFDRFGHRVHEHVTLWVGSPIPKRPKGITRG